MMMLWCLMKDGDVLVVVIEMQVVCCEKVQGIRTGSSYCDEHER